MIDEKTNIKDTIKKAEKISEKKRKQTGRRDRKLEQAVEILRLHQPLDRD